MRSFLILLALAAFALPGFSQVEKHSRWRYTLSKTEVKPGGELELVFTVDIDKDWYVYSSDFDPDLGPLVTTVTFVPHASYSLVGKLQPEKPKKKFDDIFGGDVTYFTGKGVFRQKVKILQEDPQIKGSLEYQECSEVDGKCVQHEEDFVFSGIRLSAAKETVPAPVPAKTDTGNTAKKDVKAATGTPPHNDSTEKAVQPAAPAGPGLTDFVLLAFLSGLAALLTPCVFPMIPMTVTFFTTRSPNRAQGIFKAFVYGFSIIAIYTVAGTLVARLNGPEFANWISTHWVPNVLFFLIFVVFALSFLGLFEITLPSRFVNKVDRQADKGGYYGIFFMAFTIVLVSFSCTGPIVGTILVASAGGEVIKPVLGMFAFGLAFAIPFTLFAIFPEWLKSLPKSGGWLNSVKVVLGFLELALALKFLSVADQVYHWNLLDRDVFLVLWIAIFGLMGLYLLGKLRLPHDSEAGSIGVPRLMLALLTFSFVIYLVPGLFGAPLKKLAGYLPPQATHDFDIPALIRQNPGGASAAQPSANTCGPAKYADLLHFPHGIEGYFDYEEGMACARRLGKPVFIDFTGHGCVNCREMEASVWSDPEVLKRLKNDYVVIALYIDEKTELPEAAWYTSKYDGKVKKTIGKQNADFQVTRFNNNAQPYYCLLDHEGNLLVQPRAYDLEVSSFVSFLDAGLARFGKKTLE